MTADVEQPGLCKHGYSRPHTAAYVGPFGWVYENELNPPQSRLRRMNCPGPDKGDRPEGGP